MFRKRLQGAYVRCKIWNEGPQTTKQEVSLHSRDLRWIGVQSEIQTDTIRQW
jgi:hypothetical protein